VTRHIRNPIKHHGNVSEGFTRVLNSAIRDRELGDLAFRILALLLSHQDGYEISIRGMCADLGKTRPPIRAALEALHKARYIAIQHVVTTEGNRAYETYHTNRSAKFDEQEWLGLSATITLGWVQNEPRVTDGWVPEEPRGGLDMSPEVGPEDTQRWVINEPTKNTKENTKENTNKKYSSKYRGEKRPSVDAWSTDYDPPGWDEPPIAVRQCLCGKTQGPPNSTDGTYICAQCRHEESGENSAALPTGHRPFMHIVR
jgi:hypothetical protein